MRRRFPTSTRTRSKRSAGPPSRRPSGACLERAAAIRALDRRRLREQLRRGGRDRTLRPRARHPARVLRAQRLLALRPPTRRRAPDHRGRLPRPGVTTRQLQRLCALCEDRQRRRTRQRRARRPGLDLLDDRRGMVEALATTALAQPVTRPRWPETRPALTILARGEGVPRCEFFLGARVRAEKVVGVRDEIGRGEAPTVLTTRRGWASNPLMAPTHAVGVQRRRRLSMLVLNGSSTAEINRPRRWLGHDLRGSRFARACWRARRMAAVRSRRDANRVTCR